MKRVNVRQVWEIQICLVQCLILYVAIHDGDSVVFLFGLGPGDIGDVFLDGCVRAAE